MRAILILAGMVAIALTGCTAPIKLVHYEEIETRGSRTNPILEMQGYLQVDGVAIPDAFRTVCRDGVTYRFLAPIYQGGEHGYHPAGPGVPFALDDDHHSSSTYEKGWIVGVEPSMAKPQGWLYVTWDGGSAFVRPDRVHALIDAQNIPLLSRHGLKPKPVPEKKRLMVPVKPKK